MPSTGGASGIWKVDGGFACYLVFSGDAFEVKVEEWLVHGQAASTVSFVKPTVGRYTGSVP